LDLAFVVEESLEVGFEVNVAFEDVEDFVELVASEDVEDVAGVEEDAVFNVEVAFVVGEEVFVELDELDELLFLLVVELLTPGLVVEVGFKELKDPVEDFVEVTTCEISAACTCELG